MYLVTQNVHGPRFTTPFEYQNIIQTASEYQTQFSPEIPDTIKRHFDTSTLEQSKNQNNSLFSQIKC